MPTSYSTDSSKRGRIKGPERASWFQRIKGLWDSIFSIFAGTSETDPARDTILSDCNHLVRTPLYPYTYLADASSYEAPLPSRYTWVNLPDLFTAVNIPGGYTPTSCTNLQVQVRWEYYYLPNDPDVERTVLLSPEDYTVAPIYTPLQGVQVPTGGYRINTSATYRAESTGSWGGVHYSWANGNGHHVFTFSFQQYVRGTEIQSGTHVTLSGYESLFSRHVYALRRLLIHVGVRLFPGRDLDWWMLTLFGDGTTSSFSPVNLGPSSSYAVDGDRTPVLTRLRYTATNEAYWAEPKFGPNDGQKVFTTGIVYTVGGGHIQVTKNGVELTPDLYDETSTTSIALHSPAAEGDTVVVTRISGTLAQSVSAAFTTLALEGQTVFPLHFTYGIGANELEVDIDGTPQTSGYGASDDYRETAETSITFWLRVNDAPGGNGQVVSISKKEKYFSSPVPLLTGTAITETGWDEDQVALRDIGTMGDLEKACDRGADFAAIFGGVHLLLLNNLSEYGSDAGGIWQQFSLTAQNRSNDPHTLQVSFSGEGLFPPWGGSNPVTSFPLKPWETRTATVRAGYQNTVGAQLEYKHMRLHVSGAPGSFGIDSRALLEPSNYDFLTLDPPGFGGLSAGSDPSIFVSCTINDEADAPIIPGAPGLTVTYGDEITIYVAWSWSFLYSPFQLIGASENAGFFLQGEALKVEFVLSCKLDTVRAVLFNRIQTRPGTLNLPGVTDAHLPIAVTKGSKIAALPELKKDLHVYSFFRYGRGGNCNSYPGFIEKVIDPLDVWEVAVSLDSVERETVRYRVTARVLTKARGGLKIEVVCPGFVCSWSPSQTVPTQMPVDYDTETTVTAILTWNTEGRLPPRFLPLVFRAHNTAADWDMDEMEVEAPTLTAEQAVLFYTPAPPVVSSISPTSGKVNVATPISVYGENLTRILNIHLSDTAQTQLTSVKSRSKTRATATVPSQVVPGEYPLVVVTEGGTSPEGSAIFSALSVVPRVTSISPSSSSTVGSQSNGTKVHITVYGTEFTTTGSTFRLSGPTPTDVVPDYAVSGVLRGYIPKGLSPGAYDVTVTTPYGTSEVVPAGSHTVTPQWPPNIFSVSPSSGSRRASVAISIPGEWLDQNVTMEMLKDGALFLQLGDATCTLDPISAFDTGIGRDMKRGTCRATIPLGTALGAYQIRVTTPYGSDIDGVYASGEYFAAYTVLA